MSILTNNGGIAGASTELNGCRSVTRDVRHRILEREAADKARRRALPRKVSAARKSAGMTTFNPPEHLR